MIPLPTTVHGLILARDIDALGLQPALRAAVARGEVERIRTGAYRVVATSDERGSGERDAARYRSRVRAASVSLIRPIFTAYSAAVLFGLPIRGRWPDQEFVLAPGHEGHRQGSVVAIGSRVRPEVVTLDGGVLVTSIEFSLIQLARRADLRCALYAMDAALRVDRFGRRPPLTTPDRLRAEHERMLPYKGSARVEAALRRAVTVSDSPLETESRVTIEELGFAAPVLQHRLWLPELDQEAFLDFYWPEVDAAAEADGRGKYLGSGGVGATAASVIDEKDRENAIRRQVRAFDRWDWQDALGRVPLERRLLRLGVPRSR